MIKWLAIILTAIFVMAKMMGIVAWSWLLVFTPAIIYLAFVGLVFTAITALILLG